MSANILLLTPPAGTRLPSVSALQQALNEIQFIADPFEFRGGTHFRPGEMLMQHLTFLGCSPMIASDDSDPTSEQYCHIEIAGPYPQQQFIGGANIKPLRCPHCKERTRGWGSIISPWRQDPTHQQWQCQHCGQSTPLHQIHWRRCAGFGQLFLKVWGIFESEAVPGDRLMQQLEQLSGARWEYFYYRGEPF